MKLIIRQILDLDLEDSKAENDPPDQIERTDIIDDEYDEVGLEEFVSVTHVLDTHIEEFEDGYSNRYMILDFDELKIQEFVENSDFLEIPVDEANFDMLKTVLSIILAKKAPPKEDPKKEKEDPKVLQMVTENIASFKELIDIMEQTSSDLEIISELSQGLQEGEYLIGWHNVHKLPISEDGLILLAENEMDKIDPSLAINLFWPSKPITN